jgi:thymidylate synthase (FAD)
MEVKLLDNGFIKVVDSLGSDLTVVNSARVSFANKKDEMDKKDEKLIKYLATHSHTSPFRHAYVQLHIKAPEVVARQWYKHIIGSEYAFKDQPWNEISGRYVEYKQEVYIPEVFRQQSTDNKQASYGEIADQETAKHIYNEMMKISFETYDTFLLADDRTHMFKSNNFT